MKRILVVDDEEDICEILKFNLEFAGYEVDVAFSAEEALLLNISSYHLLLLDVMMGEMSGVLRRYDGACVWTASCVRAPQAPGIYKRCTARFSG